MVEKIIINPTKVRAYGNIIGAKDSTDYDTYNAYITEITDTVYGSTSNVFSMECEPHISLTATNPYMVSGETTDLVVSLVNEFGSPVSGKTVTISDGTSLYSGITNLNGTYTKTGVSVSGDTTFTATYSSVSATCKVEYCLFVDYGVTSNNNSSNVTIYEGNRSIQDDGTHVTANANNRYDIRPNKFNVFTIPYEVEFEVIGSSGRFAVQGYNSSTTQVASLDTQSGIANGDVIRVTFESTSAKMYKNGTQLRSATYTSTASMKFRIMYNASSPYITYKNLRVKAL